MIIIIYLITIFLGSSPIHQGKDLLRKKWEWFVSRQDGEDDERDFSPRRGDENVRDGQIDLWVPYNI